MVNKNSLRYFRERNQYTQEDVAKTLGITKQAYNKLERGISRITDDKLLKLRSLYGVLVDTLIDHPDNIEKDSLIAAINTIVVYYELNGNDIKLLYKFLNMSKQDRSFLVKMIL